MSEAILNKIMKEIKELEEELNAIASSFPLEKTSKWTVEFISGHQISEPFSSVRTATNPWVLDGGGCTIC